LRVDLHDEDELDALAPAWEALHAADPGSTPFTTPGFGLAWLRRWAPGGLRPYVLAVREDGALVGLAPLVLRRRGPLRTLLPLGFWVANWWDLVAAPGRRDAVAGAVAGALSRRRDEWDVLVLDTLVPGSPLGPALRAAGLRAHRRGTRPYPGLELPATFDDYLRGLPRSHRQNLRRHLRRLDRGEVALHEVTDPARLPATVAAWQEVRGRWWGERERDLNPDHARPGFRAFMTEALQALVPAGRAVAWELRRGDELLGVSINLCDERRFLWWLSGFEPHAASLGPGKIVIGESLRRSIDAGRTRYDFMLGDEAYKYWFGGVDLDVPRLVVHSLRPRSAAARLAAGAADRVRAA
jgi:CelD/BcsL family acetyltransferase involved in cellulose biosynthesis